MEAAALMMMGEEEERPSQVVVVGFQTCWLHDATASTMVFA
jgi:hypothetical protein